MLWPFDKKFPILGNMTEQCIKLWGKVSNHVGNLTSHTLHTFFSNVNVFLILAKYVKELACMEVLL